MDQEELIKKWLNNTLSEEERLLFDALDGAQLNKEIVEGASHFKASNFSEMDGFNTLKSKRQSKTNTLKKVFKLYPLLKIASIFIIAFGLYYIFFYNNLTQIKTLASEKTTIELPDHSIVELNALSMVEFNKRTWSENRKLRLDGEAFFKVAKGKTFEVVTNEGVVTVVGTQFNVKQRQHYFEVKCFEGIVKVTSDTITRFLKVGDAYQILNGEFTERKTDGASPKWIKNMSVFNAIPIKEVIAELERQYDIEVIYTMDADRLFTGGFVHDNLESALTAITQPMNLTFKLSSSNQVTIHGK